MLAHRVASDSLLNSLWGLPLISLVSVFCSFVFPRGFQSVNSLSALMDYAATWGSPRSLGPQNDQLDLRG